MAGPESLATRSLAPAIAVGVAQLPVLFEVALAIANAPLTLAVVSFTAALLVGALELRNLLLGERSLELLLKLAQ